MVGSWWLIVASFKLIVVGCCFCSCAYCLLVFDCQSLFVGGRSVLVGCVFVVSMLFVVCLL